MKKSALLLFALILHTIVCAQLNLQWGNIFCDQAGGSQIHTITSDANNDVLILGSFGGTVDFDPGINNTSTVAPGPYDNTFVGRYTTSGIFVDVFAIGSTGQLRTHKMTTDQSGAIYICGSYTSSFDADPSSQTYTVNGSNYFKGILLKYSSNGNLEWAITFDDGSTSADIFEVAVDPFGTVIILGGYSGLTMDFDPSTGSHSVSNTSTNVCFLARYDTSGNFIDEWHYQNAYMGSSAGFTDIGFMSDSSMVLYGTTSGAMDIDPTSGVALTFGGQHAFLMRYIADSLVWCSLFPVISGNGCSATFTVDHADNVILAGHFNGQMDMNPGSGIDTISDNYGGSYDMFMSSYNSSGQLNWVFDMGSTGYDEINCVTIDPSNNIYVTGLIDGTIDFDPGVNSSITTSTGISNDPFIAIYTPTGNYRECFNFGTNNNVEYGTAALATNSGVVIAGQIRGAVDYQPGPGTTILGDMFADSYLVSFDFVTGITDEVVKSPLIFPNPMVDFTTVVMPISYGANEVEIYNSCGLLINKSTVWGNEFQIFRGDLAAGIYLVVIRSGFEFSSNQLIIE